MPRFNVKNNAETFLASAVNAETTSVEVEDVSAFPDPPFKISISEEIMDVTSVSGNLLTVERGTEDTNPATHSTGARVENRWTAGTYEQLVSQDELEEKAGGLNGRVSDLESTVATKASQSEVDALKVDYDSFKTATQNDITDVNNAVDNLENDTLVNLETYLIELNALRSIINAQLGTNIEAGITTFLAEEEESD